MFQKIAFIVFSVFLISCNQEKERSVELKNYVDIKKIFEDQITNLQKENPKVLKKIKINEITESLTLNDIDWKNEFEPFLQLDINKPAFTNSFETKETTEWLAYALKLDEKSPIKEIKLKRSNLTHGMSEISAALSDENMLFSWEKNISAYFENQKMIGFKILGSQKMIFFEEKKFEVEGKIMKK